MTDNTMYTQKALDMLDAAGIALTAEERGRVEIADFGLDAFEATGLSIITYLNTERCCAKELVLLPGQTCPEHRHPPVDGEPGKEETFRCRWGKVFLYVEGPTSSPILGVVPKGRERTYTTFHEIVLLPGEQFTLRPDMLHWFQAGAKGAVISEFSTRSRDDSDIFTDPEIQR